MCNHIQRACADKIPSLGEGPPVDLKMREEWGPQVLNMRLVFVCFKDPDTQMACNAPKNWPYFGFNKQLLSSLFFSSISIVLKDIVVRRA